MKKRGGLFLNKLFAKSNSSQLALEFIMTYGWVVMVALIAIGTLAYFGILNPDKFYPTACTLESGIGCMDFKVNEGFVTLILKNGKGEDIDISAIKVRNCTGTASGTLKNGQQATLIVDGCRNKPNTKFVSDLNITFTAESGIVHKKTGRIVGLVESGGATPPSVPSALYNLILTAGNAQISLSWSVPSDDGGSSITSYKIYRGTASNSEAYLTSSPSTSYADMGLTNAQTYYYQISAVNSVGESNKSSEASATPCNPNVIVTYGTWGSCSVTCGGGTQGRTNINQCGQNVQETQSCNTR